MDQSILVENYVRKAYEDLKQRDQDQAGQGSGAQYNSSQPQKFPSVVKALKQLPANSLVLDIGCGDNVHCREDMYTIGMDTDTPKRTRRGANVEFVIADTLHCPFRKGLFDTVLLVSVLHHIPTEEKRAKCLRNCLSLASKTGSLLITVVWSKEQQCAQFPASDVLVPYNLEDMYRFGHTSPIPFNKDTTREQRIILNSVPVRILNLPPAICCPRYLPKNVQKRVLEMAGRLAWLYPMISSVEFYEQRIHDAAQFLIEQLSRMKQIKDIAAPKKNSVHDSCVVVRDFALRLSISVLAESFAHLRQIYRDVIRYRYYHVFGADELDRLFAQVQQRFEPDLDIYPISSEFEYGNWCRIIGIGVKTLNSC